MVGLTTASRPHCLGDRGHRREQREPFTGQRGRGWSWLAKGVRVEQPMVCAVVDVAHTAAIAALHDGDLRLARTASETALPAAPHEDTPCLNLAAVVAAEGERQAAAERIIKRRRAQSPGGRGRV